MKEKKTKRKTRTKLQREKHLAAIALFERNYPSKYSNMTILVNAVAQQLNLSIATARRDVQEVRRRRKKAAQINREYELGKKLEELASVKEIALQQGNMNAYLGALNAESSLLGLDKLSILVGVDEDVGLSIKLKKKAIYEKLMSKKEQEGS